MDRLKNLINEFSFSATDIQDDTDLINDLYFDSLQIIRLLAEIENEYDLKMPYDTINYEIFNNYKRLEMYIKERIELSNN